MAERTWSQRLLALLRVRSAIGGLEVSDTVLRYVYPRDAGWQMVSVRLPGGVVEGGKIVAHDAFVEALQELKKRITGVAGQKRSLNVVVSLSSITVYSQVFSLPMIKGENLEKAVQLNIQMVSPEEASQTYSGWQRVGEDQKTVRMEILSVFIDRAVVDELKRALEAAGFVPFSIESRSLSIARLVRSLGEGIDPDRSYILLNVDAGGLQFLILRRGHLYFEYFTPWRDIENEGGQLTMDVFGNVLARSMHQVLNFYRSHWSEPVDEILLSSNAMKAEISEVLAKTASLPVRELSLKANVQVGSDWYVAIGSGLRGLIPRREDSDISLLGATALQEFRRHQVVNFLQFWRALVPLAMSVLVAAAFGVSSFLSFVRSDVDGQLAASAIGPEQNAQITEVRERARSFNDRVSRIVANGKPLSPRTILFGSVGTVFRTNQATIERFLFSGQGAPIQVALLVPSQDLTRNVKRALEETPGITSVDMPITEIKTGPQGTNFSVSFTIASEITE